MVKSVQPHASTQSTNMRVIVFGCGYILTTGIRELASQRASMYGTSLASHMLAMCAAGDGASGPIIAATPCYGEQISLTSSIIMYTHECICLPTHSQQFAGIFRCSQIVSVIDFFDNAFQLEILFLQYLLIGRRNSKIEYIFICLLIVIDQHTCKNDQRTCNVIYDEHSPEETLCNHPKSIRWVHDKYANNRKKIIYCEHISMNRLKGYIISNAFDDTNLLKSLCICLSDDKSWLKIILIVSHSNSFFVFFFFTILCDLVRFTVIHDRFFHFWWNVDPLATEKKQSLEWSWSEVFAFSINWLSGAFTYFHINFGTITKLQQTQTTYH